MKRKRDRWASSDEEEDEDEDKNVVKEEKKAGPGGKGAAVEREPLEEGEEVSESGSSKEGEGGSSQAPEGGRRDLNQPSPSVASPPSAGVAGEGGDGKAKGKAKEAHVATKMERAIQEIKEIFGKEEGEQARETKAAAEGGEKESEMEEVKEERPQDNWNPLVQGCRSVEVFERMEYIDEGSYGKVFKARNKVTKEIVAIKQVKMSKDAGKEGFPVTALRETNVLLSLTHPNIMRVHEMLVGSSAEKIYMVMEYFDRDLKDVMSKMKKRHESFSTSEVKNLMLQLLRAVEHLHRHWYIHRDLKTSNLLYNSKGKVAICDFGLARKYEEPIQPYTQLVVTLWYRPPELLLGEKVYSTAVDMWSLGCIFGEIVLGEPMMKGKGEVDQMNKIFNVLGAPSEDKWPGWSKLPLANQVKWSQGSASKLRDMFPATSFSGGPILSKSGYDLLQRMLSLDPSKRISAEEALEHPWFTDYPLPKKCCDMPKP